MHGLLAEAERGGELAAGVTPHRTGAVVLAATTGTEVLAREDHDWLARPSLTDLWRLLLPCVAAPRVAGALDPAGSGSAEGGPVESGPAAPDLQADAGRVGLAVRWSLAVGRQ
ncbi:hypothetical protein [Streptomyces sp. NPDC093598]|uniref:hypothetical protein n=1 Tax=Streptomyces sp. NPDC093598 TaxID=3366046 RepID=UPI00381066CD